MKTEPETITVTDLRERTREILENAHFKGKCYKVERAGQEMVVIVGADEFDRLNASCSAAQHSISLQNRTESGSADLIS